MEPLARLLPELIRLSNGQPEVLSAACCAAWALSVGDATLRASRAVALTDRTLTVAVQDARWKRQLEVLAPQILFRLNGLLRQPLVTRIHIIVDRKFVAAENRRPAPAALPPVTLPTELVESASVIRDEALRAQFLRLAAACFARDRLAEGS
ncbi:DciA family protein [Chloracidobacterium thermophilum]|uniref:DUF721 domain-containing protein n=1 Tax=Chloracidobacterium thermophilum (strain B) TaxID=981222 RepID=G2LGH5_CHLTF|nr:DciA family protein [Chloracidobacterium thermophilum]AEP10935.1 Protein of unknown function (DUF721) [Chloracidobacterium thermophilum B]QUV78861.1 DUF721 domain-containing protein [Chloracidobacterium thermophilum]